MSFCDEKTEEVDFSPVRLDQYISIAFPKLAISACADDFLMKIFSRSGNIKKIVQGKNFKIGLRRKTNAQTRF